MVLELVLVLYCNNVTTMGSLDPLLTCRIVNAAKQNYPTHVRLLLATVQAQDYYAAVLMQMPQEDLEKNADELRHQPLAFISGRFVKAMYNWSVPEKEAFAIVAAMTRLRYLTIMRTVHVHKDHRNLTFIYDPKSSNPNIASYVASKLQRWGVILSEFDYAVYPIDGELNYFADLKTRWAVSKLRRLVTAPVSTPDADDNEQHLIDLVKASQADLIGGGEEAFGSEAKTRIALDG
jgi:RNase H-like domain found in reverse transcriptase